MKDDSEKRYEAVVKHYLKGVLHMAFFDERDKATSWLIARWREVDVESVADRATSYGATVYDQHDSRQRIFTLGAPYVTDEKYRNS